MATTEDTDGPPPFGDPFEGEDVEQRLYGAVLQTREPVTASTLATRVGCDPKTARKYLRWFAELGVVSRREGSPVTYRRNDDYFEWRRVDRLATKHTVEDLGERVADLTARIEGYEEAYDAGSPADVDAIEATEENDELDVDEVYRDLADWETALAERQRCERARQRLARVEPDRVSG